MVNEWIETLGGFTDEDTDKVVPARLVFKKSDVVAFNEGEQKNTSCIRLSSGFDIIIAIGFDDLKRKLRVE